LCNMKKNFIKSVYKHFITDSIRIVKESGLKELLRRRGWKFFLIIFLYYLIRDSILYIIIPFYVAMGC
jgi:hypothetical protein